MNARGKSKHTCLAPNLAFEFFCSLFCSKLFVQRSAPSHIGSIAEMTAKKSDKLFGTKAAQRLRVKGRKFWIGDIMEWRLMDISDTLSLLSLLRI